ncbi:DNA-dependent RNA polymerase auxiliary subunit epsilon [Chryseobacterium sp. SORGH_AS909]|uniref:DNA-dependent RNA polymerase auxiliary subunit epsilon n=1 Tax=Chryseobacterium camelliae TaxID=1265445 RepID=A0ABU0TFW8_9FLAO|nr:DNA-dependent RNA polymerase auxiliary subunit epsilon [Chryseobacterium camelliae]MDQ1099885.1 DNA-dependent RNA polymerase auxiliary subunit epsilon [Chryseobacterium sp. SORGH_AS_1048]MDR6087231.1 DNA-dependent RNA polymerase auxiliary subunit epsilon [Chryseobacterium sp. SORGH_AS_0909]MDR6131605.1 DNA-dependent RNA polymerase auxiliary subunit epsilon [Chryseobacterium sp. SORGH_AS_1175]MDT3406252.1 DNA-dependent RNA polymerase auxiliary subunit epsilon [Pseudacidovorax intermedius]
MTAVRRRRTTGLSLNKESEQERLKVHYGELYQQSYHIAFLESIFGDVISSEVSYITESLGQLRITRQK